MCSCFQSTGNTEGEDACYEFKQEQDLTHRTHLYYLDYDFSPVSIYSVEHVFLIWMNLSNNYTDNVESLINKQTALLTIALTKPCLNSHTNFAFSHSCTGMWPFA